MVEQIGVEEFKKIVQKDRKEREGRCAKCFIWFGMALYCNVRYL